MSAGRGLGGCHERGPGSTGSVPAWPLRASSTFRQVSALGDVQQCPSTILLVGLAPEDMPLSGAGIRWQLVHVTISSTVAHTSATSKDRNDAAGMAVDRKNEREN